MTSVLVPSAQLGIKCSSFGCECVFGASQNGVIGHEYLSALAEAGVKITPSIYDYLSAENFSNTSDSVAEALTTIDAGSLDMCEASLPVLMSPAPDLLRWTIPSEIDAIQRQRMLGGSGDPAYRRAFESMRRMQRRSGSGVIENVFLQDTAFIRRAVISDIGRGGDMVAHQTGRNAVIIPQACPSFVDEDGVSGWGALADGRSGSSNSGSRAVLKSALNDAAAMSGFGLPSDGIGSSPSDSGSQLLSQARSLCVHISSGYPIGCVEVVGSTALPDGQTYRPPLTAATSANFSHQALVATSRMLFRESGATLANFGRRLMNPPFHLAVSGVSGASAMSSSWYGMLSIPHAFVENMIKPMYMGCYDAGLRIESIIIADDMERLLSIATSSSHPQRYSVRRCLEHQFLHKKLKLAAHTRVRIEGLVSNVSSVSWNLQDASPDEGGCLPDEMWCDLDDVNGHDWKSLAAYCGHSDSNWHAYRYSRAGLPMANPFLGMQFVPKDFNSSQASAIASLPSLSAREVVDLIRWEFLEWTRQVGRHVVNLIASNGRYVAADTDAWKTLTHGQVEI